MILYDTTGLSYSMPEQNQNIPLCNLIDISIVYNNQQIWANLQPEIHPSLDTLIGNLKIDNLETIVL